ncbi:MAG: roadblock/LC7 domain-containing protein [Methanobacteriaceae archaeon]|nr:roadblock/LC7 domain-containing protein [Methanobacteriaceae archaeon]MDP2835601.1 roadblock/LC7 domain-containing protein [Methanobacteriaceae archaeon]MDP3033800.1 roadblock/LC7 domain-containing protein [Methanobacteriaceae archaeon]MDP3484586.1 roadblock/LC7 domain-containing protein [Methanobacteriaceae archaeon]MDP3623665.1 roadblock/LC7 domain-containing protein [Methanobacteriaceae archaeon]
MSKTKKEKLDDVLSAFMQVGQIKACGIVSKEGLLINSRAPPDVDARIFSALCSTIMGAAEAASGQMNTGSVNEISVRTEKGIIILKPAGDKAIFNALTEPNAQLGLILFEMESRASQVDEILKEM